MIIIKSPYRNIEYKNEIFTHECRGNRKTLNFQTPLLCIFINRMFNDAEMYTV